MSDDESSDGDDPLEAASAGLAKEKQGKIAANGEPLGDMFTSWLKHLTYISMALIHNVVTFKCVRSITLHHCLSPKPQSSVMLTSQQLCCNAHTLTCIAAWMHPGKQAMYRLLELFVKRNAAHMCSAHGQP